MAFIVNPPLSEAYLTAVSFRVANVIPSSLFGDGVIPAVSETNSATPGNIAYSIWLKELTGVEATLPFNGTPVFTGGGGGSARPSSGFLYPRGLG